MKKNYIFIILISTFLTTLGQSHEKGSFIVNLGLGVGVYNGTYKSGNDENDNTGKFGLVNIPIKVEYGLKSKLSVGLLLQPLSVDWSGTDEDSGEKRTVKISGSFIAPSINYHFTPDRKTDYYIGFAPGFTGFNWDAAEPATATIETGKFGGFGMKFDLGARFYIGNKVSLNLNLAYGIYSTKLKSYSENGVPFNYPKGKLNFNGVEPSLGLGFKI